MLGETPPFVAEPVTGPFGEAHAIFETVKSPTHNQYQLDDEGVGRRTVVVDTNAAFSLDFSITAEQQETLFTNGINAGQAFLARSASQSEQPS